MDIGYCLIVYWLVLGAIYFALTLAGLDSYIVPVLVANYAVGHFYVKQYKKTLDIPQAFTIGLFGALPVAIAVTLDNNISIFSQENYQGNLIFIGACLFMFLANTILLKVITDQLDTKLKNT